MQSVQELLLPYQRAVTRVCDTCERKSCFISVNCSREWKLLFSKFKQAYSVPPDTVIFEKGQTVEGVFTIYSGFVKVLDGTKDAERIIRLAGAAQILGHRGFGEGFQKYPVSAIAYTQTDLTFFPMDIFRLAVQANAKMSMYMMFFFARELRKADVRGKLMNSTSALEKMIYAIADIIESWRVNPDGMLSFTPPRKDIAGLAGLTYETVTRTLHNLQLNNKIEIVNKEIRIIDKEYFTEQYELHLH